MSDESLEQAYEGGGPMGLSEEEEWEDEDEEEEEEDGDSGTRKG